MASVWRTIGVLLCFGYLPSSVFAEDSLLPTRVMTGRLTYQLTPSESDTIFRAIQQRVMPDNMQSRERPLLVIVAGQPGSGKSTRVNVVAQTHAEPFFIMARDVLHEYHPQKKALDRQYHYFANFYTNYDANLWFNNLLAASLANRWNVIMPRSGISPTDDVAWFREVRMSGYRIKVEAIATSASVSEQSIVERYEHMKYVQGVGRMTARQTHDRRYVELPERLREIEEAALVDDVTVLSRDGVVLYENHWIEGKWERPPAAHLVLEAERARPMTSAEKGAQCARVGRIVALMKKNGTVDEEPARYATMATLLSRVCPDSDDSRLMASPFAVPKDAL